MEKIIFSSQFFNIYDTLSCGQTFRFYPHDKGYIVLSTDKCAYCYYDGDNVVIETDYPEYFYNYFDLDRDYNKIYNSAVNEREEFLRISAKQGKGIRILNQEKSETLFSFIVSQNNNIPRIKGIIEKLCLNLGEKRSFLGFVYYTFPSVNVMASKDENFYKSIGLGYRAGYIKRLADDLSNGLDLESYSKYSTYELKKALVSIYGVGPKVADCVLLFGYHRTDSFPVDTWIEKVYRENFDGKLTDRNKITDYFLGRFGDNSGYVQQYLFHYKRNIEK